MDYIKEIAQNYLDTYRSFLKVDDLCKFNITIERGDFISRVQKDSNIIMSWTCALNDEKHTDHSDIKYSIIDFLVKVMCSDLDIAGDTNYDELKNRVILRIVMSFDAVLPTLEE